MTAPQIGTLLIAEPFLKDPNFIRSTILICENDEFGTLGFSLSKKLRTTLSEIVADMIGLNLPVYHGGPVCIDTLHYIHQYPQYFDDAVKVIDGIYWGGNFETLKNLLKNNTIDKNKVKFFLGYSGWSEGQLEEELAEHTWITSEASKEIIFETEANDVWKKSLTNLGGKYKMMVNFPTDPQLN